MRIAVDPEVVHPRGLRVRVGAGPVQYVHMWKWHGTRRELTVRHEDGQTETYHDVDLDPLRDHDDDEPDRAEPQTVYDPEHKRLADLICDQLGSACDPRPTPAGHSTTRRPRCKVIASTLIDNGYRRSRLAALRARLTGHR